MKGFDAMIQPGRAGRMARTELAADVARPGTCDRNPIHMPLNLLAREAGRVKSAVTGGYSLHYQRIRFRFPGGEILGATMVEIDVV